MLSRKHFWFAGVAAGSIVAMSGQALAQDINETVNGPSSGVVAAGTGTQNVTVTITKKGDVDNPAGTAVTATAQQGNVTVTDHGQVTGSAGGILGQTAGPNVSVTVTQSVAGGTGNAVEALDQAAGAAGVTVGDGQNRNHPLTITTTGKVAAGAISVTGNAAIQAGGNVTVTAGAPGEAGVAGVLALGVVTPADTNGPSAVATVGKNATITVLGNGSAAVAAQIGQSGIVGPNGTAGTQVTVGDGVNINVSGFNDAGVIGFVDDLTPAHLYAGTGNVSVSVGTGTVNVNENGAVGVPSGAQTILGVGAFSAGGDVSVSNAADVTVSGGQEASVGLSATTTGAGSATITGSGDVSSANGTAVNVATQSGLASVTLTGGEITASGIGVDATSSSANIVVSLAKSTSVTAGGAGVSAVTGGAGSVSVISAGAIGSTGGDGIDATTGGGLLTVAVGGDIASFGDGVNANSTNGPIVVGIGKSGAVVAGGIGVNAESAGPVTVDDEGTVAAVGDGVFAQSNGGSVGVTINGDVATATGTDAVEALAVSASSATVIVGSGSHAHPLTITGALNAGVVAVSVFGEGSVTTGDNVSVSVGAPGVSRVADVDAIGLLTASGVGANVAVGRNATLTLAGNTAAAVVAQIGQSGLQGPIGSTASAAATVGNGVAINVSGYADAGVIAFATDISQAPVYFGTGDASVTVGTGAINVNEVGALNPPVLPINIGEGAFSAGGNVSIANAANISVSGVVDTTDGLTTDTGGNGSSTITTSGDITVNNGQGILGRTRNGANSIDVLGGVVTGSGAGAEADSTGSGTVTVDVDAGASLNGAAGLRASSGSGAIGIDNAGLINGGGAGGVVAQTLGLTTITNESIGRIVGPGSLGAPALNLVGSGANVIDNRGLIGTQMTDHTGQFLFEGVTSGLAITNEASGVLDGVFMAGGNVTFNNAGTWQTAAASDFGAAGGNVLNNTGLIQIGQNVASGAPSAAAFLDLGAFNNGSASATGVISMVDQHVGDTLTVSGLFTGAVGHSLLALDVQLGGPGSTADELILQGGSAGKTLIRVNDVLHGHAALNPVGIVLVQGSSAASTFALDPTQPGYDPATQGIDKGLFTYPLVYSGGNELLVGEPGLSARQLATMGAAAEDVWSSTSPGDQSETHLAASLANGGDDEMASGPHVWAQAVGGGTSRLNGGQTLLGRASFAGDPTVDGGPPLAGVVQQTSNVSAYGMSYGFNTGYAQNVSALLTGIDLGRRVGQQDAWSWGVSTGYLESQQAFTAGSSVAQYQGALAAIHGAYVNANGFHVAGDVKMTALQVNYATAWGGGGTNAPHATIDTFGGEADAGWSRPIGGGWTLEPVASLSVQSSKLGALAISGTDLRFGDASSARLGFGARLNGGGQLFGLVWKSQSSLQLWDELHGANTLELATAGVDQLLPDPIGGTFTDASESLSLQSPDGRASAFVSGAYRWKPDYQAAQLSMGVKLAW